MGGCEVGSEVECELTGEVRDDNISIRRHLMSLHTAGPALCSREGREGLWVGVFGAGRLARGTAR